MLNPAQLQLLPNHLAFLQRFVKACEADDRIVAAFLGGSNAKGYADQYSDLDVCVITTDRDNKDFYNQRELFLRSLGDLVFLEDFGSPDIAFFIFTDGIEGELYFGSQSRLDQIHSGPFRILLDKRNILADAVFAEQQPQISHQMEELRRNVIWFWHEFSHFITATGREQLWWARGQLEALRSICVNLARLQNNFSDGGVGEEPYFKIENAMPTAVLTSLINTFPELEKESMLEAAFSLVHFYKEIAIPLAEDHGIAYPAALEHVMTRRLEMLQN